MDGWKDKKNRWMVGWLKIYEKNMDGWMDKKIYEKNMDGWMEKKIKKQMDGQKNRWMVGWIDMKKYGWLDG